MDANFNPIPAQTEEDLTPSLRDITVLNLGGALLIVVSDYDGKSLKAVYRSDQINSILTLEGSPHGLSHLNDMLFVAVPNVNKILKVKVNSTPTISMEIHSQIQTLKKYMSISVQHDVTPPMLIAGARKSEDVAPASVDIMDMEGSVLKSITAHHIMEPLYLCYTDTCMILVSDGYSGKLVCLNQDGETLWMTDSGTLDTPRGVTTSRSGNIVLALRDNDKVLQLTATGNTDQFFVRHDVKEPVGVCIYTFGDQEVLYVCSNDHIFRFPIA